MGYPRKKNYKEGDAGLFHCVVRCVRKAELCGEDKETGRCFKHRKAWIQSRLVYQTGVFAIEVQGYAIMDNHLHTIIRLVPDVADAWTPLEVASRWLAIFPPPDLGKTPKDLAILKITSNPERVKVLRKRLCSLSWFNRVLNERISRMANKEDNCKGHFWESRFYSQKILDIPAAIACSVYVDLNPVRAGLCKTPEESEYTSIKERIMELQGTATKVPLTSIERAFKGLITTQEYITLVDLTGRTIVDNKASIPADIDPILARLGVNSYSWLNLTQNLRRIFRRVVGSKRALEAEEKLLNRALGGKAAATEVFHTEEFRSAA